VRLLPRFSRSPSPLLKRCLGYAAMRRRIDPRQQSLTSTGVNPIAEVVAPRQGWQPARGRPATRGFSAAASPAPKGRRPNQTRAPYTALYPAALPAHPAAAAFSGILPVAQAFASAPCGIAPRIHLERGLARGYEWLGAVRAVLGRRNPTVTGWCRPLRHRTP